MEQRSYMEWGPVCTLDGSGYGNSHSVQLPEWLPDPMEIVGCELSIQGGPFPAGVNCKAMVKLDRAGRFNASTGGWPGHEEAVNGDEHYKSGLFRLVICDILPGARRHEKNLFNPPVTYSRERGDLLQIDVAGGSNLPLYQFQPCWTLYFISPEGWELPEPPPPPGAPAPDVMGTWNGTLAAARTLNGNPNNMPFGGLRFARTSDVTSVKVNVTHAYVSGQVHLEIWSDVSGAPGVKLSQSASQLISAPGEVTFNVACPSGSYLWACLVQETTSANIEYQTVANDLSKVSARGPSIPAFSGNNVPNSTLCEQWRMRIA